jgi:hypothetical protein
MLIAGLGRLGYGDLYFFDRPGNLIGGLSDEGVYAITPLPGELVTAVYREVALGGVLPVSVFHGAELRDRFVSVGPRKAQYIVERR